MWLMGAANQCYYFMRCTLLLSNINKLKVVDKKHTASILNSYDNKRWKELEQNNNA